MSILKQHSACPCCGEEQSAIYASDKGVTRVRCEHCTLDAPYHRWAQLHGEVGLARKRLFIMRLAGIGLSQYPLAHEWQDNLVRALNEAADGRPSKALRDYNNWFSQYIAREK